ncbi:WXG100 family type VII secretion target [Streptoalloteichus tenebrarius]|uniref:WXG100 family type VII secretion target n=1 Tax=Streptoalloteichus tenebrarius (strain ATCC 17920 / DSM 40477 / JCM 4838 / CBS 697.72 / NBRC 16177 / NCIMB 11028 / NRRL B-12390 / A12253. 1 / ISP 5477) TaxID=1933 RepID=UPI0020A3DD82|nr:hypothetical protein [Streptoalloteichus tenebrarius]BFF01335.1 hypothetical protein GCM10020241_30100 [Streptoalloteichus tenebrarius]
MVSYGDVRRWRDGPLDETEQLFRKRSDTLVGLADELHDMAGLGDWRGEAADAARARCGRLVDEMEHLVAGVNAARTGVMAAADGVTGLGHLVAEAESLARAHGFTIDDAGVVTDAADLATNAEVPADQAEEIGRERERIRAELRDRVQRIVARATEVDHDLTDVFAKVRDGRITDGGATTLLAAADAGALQGVAKPGIPGPPPRPQVDRGAGAHGSTPENWFGERIKKELAAKAAVFADSVGWTHAAKHLWHFLDNSGTPMSVSPDEIIGDVPEFRTEVDKAMAAQMRRLAEEAEANGTYGKPVAFNSGWRDFYIGPELNKDWYYALGGVEYAVTGVATVHPPDRPGGEPRVEMDYQVHVFDRYNWDGSKSTSIGPIVITDQTMAEMHRAGVAQEYDVSGSSETRHYTGPVPPVGGKPDLPQPPPDRDDRTDPQRK